MNLQSQNNLMHLMGLLQELILMNFSLEQCPAPSKIEGMFPPSPIPQILPLKRSFT